MTSRRHVLAWHLGALGDLIVAIPALRALRRAFRPARLMLAGHPARVALLAACGAAQEALDGTSADLAPLFAPEGPGPNGPFRSPEDGPLWLIERVRNASAVALFFEQAGPLAARLRKIAPVVLEIPPRPPPGATIHASDFLLRRTLAAIEKAAPSAQGCLAPGRARDLAPARPRLRLRPGERREADSALGRLGLGRAGFLALHAGSGGRAKCWPAERFLALAGRAPSSLGLAPLLIFGPVEEESRPELIRETASRGLLHVVSPPLPLLAALLSRARLYVGNDSGVTHLAAAVGTPTLALFGPSDPRIFSPRPRGRHATVTTIEAGERLAALGVEDVLFAARSALEQSRSRCRTQPGPPSLSIP